MTTPNRLSRTHARIARILEAAPPSAVGPTERAFDLAHHWLAAGPLYAGSAWPAAAAAGALAADDFANVEAANLFHAALGAQAADPQGTAYERFDLLLRFNESAARAGMWREAVDAVVEAVAVARALDDPGRVATAVASLTRYSVWTPMDFGVVEHELVDDLRATLAWLDAGGSSERCTLMLALAAQALLPARVGRRGRGARRRGHGAGPAVRGPGAPRLGGADGPPLAVAVSVARGPARAVGGGGRGGSGLRRRRSRGGGAGGARECRGRGG